MYDLYTLVERGAVRVKSVLSKNTTQQPRRVIELSQLAIAAAGLACNKHGHHSPAVFLGILFNPSKKLIYHAGLGITVKFFLGTRVDQLNTITTQNWKEKDKITIK